jgi:peptide-methionine (S)-S-oxide reductase
MATGKSFPDPAVDLPLASSSTTQSAVLAGGCFWCVEAVYQQLDGVTHLTSGYAGGTKETANYRTVCSGTTDHAESVKIDFDGSKLTYGQLLKVFFSVAHDPTDLNRQGNDVGRQYRSTIFYENEDQRRIAEAYIQQLNAARVFTKPIATTLEPLTGFYEAEAYHQDYAARNPNQPYIAFVAMPKVDKVREYYPDKMKR